MVASVLPLYLVVQLNLSPLAFGALDGLYNGVTAVTRWAGGIVGDRWRRHKEVAAAGYVLSAVSRLGLLLVGRDVSALAAVIASDRLGKGIRTVPRDTLISLSASRQQLGQSFGVHRALDATGAMLGPLSAFALLALVPGRFDVVFVTSFCVAVVGLGVLVLFVENINSPSIADAGGQPGSIRAALGLLHRPDFRRVVTAASGLALLTVSDAFIYLVLREQVQLGAHLFPLLYVGTALFYLVLAVPIGWLADRWGRSRIFVAGHGVLLVLYMLLLSPPERTLGLLLAVALLGGYYAATDGVTVALASGMLPPSLRGSGLAVLTTATSLSRLVASIAFGWAWTLVGMDIAIASFGLALTVGIVFASMVLGLYERNSDA
jgi:predicted MFS family arabinose efflux permease